tara:strand:+ start:827 stop:1042 length:216 start_codon:yes stop_codon:yes gene_type:complete
VKVGDLVAYAWNPKERPEEVELAIVMDIDPPNQWREGEYVQICLQREPGLDRPLKVPRWKLDVVKDIGGHK